VSAGRHIDAFLEMMAAERGASENTLAAYGRDLEGWNAALSFLQMDGLRKDNPAHSLRGPKQGRGLPKVLSHDDIAALFTKVEADTSVKGIRLRTQLEVLYAGGLRVTELVSLKLNGQRQP